MTHDQQYTRLAEYVEIQTRGLLVRKSNIKYLSDSLAWSTRCDPNEKRWFGDIYTHRIGSFLSDPGSGSAVLCTKLVPLPPHRDCRSAHSSRGISTGIQQRMDPTTANQGATRRRIDVPSKPSNTTVRTPIPITPTKSRSRCLPLFCKR